MSGLVISLVLIAVAVVGGGIIAAIVLTSGSDTSDQVSDATAGGVSIFQEDCARARAHAVGGTGIVSVAANAAGVNTAAGISATPIVANTMFSPNTGPGRSTVFRFATPIDESDPDADPETTWTADINGDGDDNDDEIFAIMDPANDVSWVQTAAPSQEIGIILARSFGETNQGRSNTALASGQTLYVNSSLRCWGIS